MRKYFILIFLLTSSLFLFGQRSLPTCNICLTGTSQCNSTFNLTEGQTYQFSTDVQSGASYSWVVTGNLTIVGSSNQSTVQVQATGDGIGNICLIKCIGGECCCICYTVIVDPVENCPSLGVFYLLNNPEIPDVWCCDYAANYLYFTMSPFPGTATVTFRRASDMAIVGYFPSRGSDMAEFWPNGIYLSNSNPPACGQYLVQIVNDCNPEDVIGGFINVVQCGVNKLAFPEKEKQKPSSQLSLKVFPNPVTSDNLNVRLSGLSNNASESNQNVSIRLVDIGFTRQVGVYNFKTSDKLNINTSGIAKGVYILIVNVDGKTISKKVVIQ